MRKHSESLICIPVERAEMISHPISLSRGHMLVCSNQEITWRFSFFSSYYSMRVSPNAFDIMKKTVT